MIYILLAFFIGIFTGIGLVAYDIAFDTEGSFRGFYYTIMMKVLFNKVVN